jgi:endogenous inhibitor of DNA gyrase (YacG/DUF329 family)
MADAVRRIVLCPTCGNQVPWGPESRYRPFCSERCRLIDLGQWATEQFRIPNEADPDGTDAADDSGAK